MKPVWVKILKYLLLTTAVILATLIAYLMYLSTPQTAPQVADTQLDSLDSKFKSHMLKREGAYYSKDGKYRPPVSDTEEQFRQQIKSGVRGNTGIIINSESFDGSYVKAQGGPMDIVEGSSVEYVLYGKEVGQYYVDSKLAWNDSYQFLYADFYLIRFDKDSDQGEIVKEWLNQTNSYGHLLYDPNSSQLTVDLCSIDSEGFLVNDELYTKDSGHDGFNIICSSKY